MEAPRDGEMDARFAPADAIFGAKIGPDMSAGVQE